MEVIGGAGDAGRLFNSSPLAPQPLRRSSICCRQSRRRAGFCSAAVRSRCGGVASSRFLFRASLLLLQATAVAGTSFGKIVTGFRRGSDPTYLRDAAGVAIAPNGDILVADTNNHRVQRCEVDSASCITVAGGVSGAGASQLNVPYAVLATPDDVVWVVDTGNHRIQRWDPGATAGVTVVGGAGTGVLSYPSSITFDEARRQFYIADTGKQRIVRFSITEANELFEEGMITVAGVENNPGNGSDMMLLNNPTGVFYDADGDRIFVSDARNKRILSWPFGSTSSDEGNGWVFDIKGRPYGLAVLQGALYYADYDECIVWKVILDNLSSFNAAGRASSCGLSTEQLQTPGGIALDKDGTLFVADSGNNRVLRFGPEPLKRDYGCYFSQECTITALDLNPTELNLIAVVSAEGGNRCGGSCSSSDLSGGLWSSVARIASSLERSAVFNFGDARVGDVGEYLLCYGSHVSEDEIGMILDEGNCSEVPYEVGKLQMQAYVEIDASAMRETSQCVQGAACNIVLEGYMLPNGTTIVSPPGSGLGANFTCRDLSGASFTGYREFVSTNPGASEPVRWLLSKDDDFTSDLYVDLGVAISVGTRHLCLCYGGIACSQPNRFKLDAGLLAIRGSYGGESWSCLWDNTQNCSLQVNGAFLRSTDFIGIAEVDQDCRTILDRTSSGDTLNVFTMPFVSPLVAASSAGMVDGDYFTTFNIGMPQSDGRFKVCYCASYDSDDINETACDDSNEFTQEAGILEVFRVLPRYFECAVGRICSIYAEGIALLSTDLLIVDSGDSSICGGVGPFVFNGTGNIYQPLDAVSWMNYSRLDFELQVFDTAGERYACYCASEDVNDGVACNYEVEFYQQLAPVIIRGPQIEVLGCVQDQNCSITVQGFQLSENDQLQICPYERGNPCNAGVLCEPAGPEAASGLLTPLNATASATQFELGILPVGSYTLCYCAPGRDPTHASAISCNTESDLTMLAGTLNIKGLDSNQLHSCVEGAPCSIVVKGFALSNTDKIVVAPLEDECGKTVGVTSGTFLPSNVMQTNKRVESETERPFYFDNATVAGRFKICYCPLTECNYAEAFSVTAGFLFVKGLLPRPIEARCTVDEPCAFRTQGFGLNEAEDSAMLVPKALGCGGSFVQVRGDRPAEQDGAVTLNGTYRRLVTLSEGRVQFESEEHQQLLFYNTYFSRWLLGPYKDPDIPEEPGFAWVGGLNAVYPDRSTELPWKIWDAEASQWVNWPSLEVYGAKAEPGTFDFNPTTELSDKVEDTALGYPYVLAETFSLGTASRKGVYRICFCPATDLADIDQESCSSEDEHFATDGFLSVGVVRGDERYHCALDGSCIVRTVLPSSLDGPSVLWATLLPGGARCTHAEEYGNGSGWDAAANLSAVWIDGEGVFDFGIANVSGVFEVCVCTDYDIDGDGTPCDSLHEFYEHIGTLTVAPFIRRLFTGTSSSGDSVPVVLNLTREAGLEVNDTLMLVQGDNCSFADLSAGLIAQPSSIADDGAWAEFTFGDEGDENLPSGSLSACLCPDFDGSDDDDLPCSTDIEFSALVGRITISVMVPPRLVTEASSDVQVRLELGDVASAGGSRRMADFWGPDSGDELLSRSQFITLFESSMSRTLALSTTTVLMEAAERAGTAAPAAISADAISVKVNTLEAEKAASNAGASVMIADVAFTATVAGEVSALLSPTCPYPTVEPFLVATSSADSAATSAAASASAPIAERLGACLALPMAFGDAYGSETLRVLRTSLLQVSPSLGISLLNVNTLGISPAEGFFVGVQPPMFNCVQGMPCETMVYGNQVVLFGGAVLAIDGGDAQCGSLSVDAGSTTAASRAAVGFGSGLDGDGLILLDQLGTAVQEMPVSWGAVARAGEYTLCYCMEPDSSNCIYDKQFDQWGGFLLIRGVASKLPAECTAWSECSITIFGEGLSPLDRLHVIPESQSCGNMGATLAPSVGINPAADPVVPPSEDHARTRRFTIGINVEVGSYRICYCAANDGSTEGFPSITMPCTSSEHFNTDAGILWVRGIDIPDFEFVAPRSDTANAPSTFSLTGQGMMPGFDKVMLLKWDEGECGAENIEAAKDLAPNPAPVSAASAMIAWGTSTATSEVTFQVKQATQVGDYRVCFCTESASTRCGLTTSYLHQAGKLTVQGARSDQLFVCREGFPCMIDVQGVLLGPSDRITIVHEDIVCGYGELDAGFAAGGPFKASGAADSGENATFDLGHLVLVGSEMAYRVCYCPTLNADGEGEPCTSPSDYSHSAGIVNTVVCPDRPAYTDFVPHVQDVFAGTSDDTIGVVETWPRVSLWTTEEQACIGDHERSDDELGRFSGPFSPAGVGVFSKSVLLSTAPRRCNVSISTSLARMKSLAMATLRLETLNPGSSSWNFPGDADPDRLALEPTQLPLLLPRGPWLRATASVQDVAGNSFTCPAWEVRFVSLACDWTGGAYFGILLHMSFCIAGAVLVISTNAKKLGEFLRRFKKRITKRWPGDPEAKESKPSKPPGSSTAKEMIGAGLDIIVRASPDTIVSTFRRNAQAWHKMELAFHDEDPCDKEEPPIAPRPKRGFFEVHDSDLETDHKGEKLAPKVVEKRKRRKARGDMVLGMLAGRYWPMIVLFARLSIFAFHSCMLWFQEAGSLGVLTLFVLPGVCGCLAWSFQLLIIAAIEGRAGILQVGKFWLQSVYSFLSVSRIHLDLALPLLLRKHHCEMRRVASVLLFLLVLVQLVIPAFEFFLNLLPPLRKRSEDSRKALNEMLTIPENQQALEEPVLLASTATKGATKQAPSEEPGAGRPGTAQAFASPYGDADDNGDIALWLGDDKFPGEVRPSSFAMRLRQYKSHLSLIQLPFPASFARSPPEHLQRRRLVGLYAFMDACGWDVATYMMRAVIQRSTGMELIHLEARASTFSLLFGGLDITALQAFLFFFYYSRLSSIEAFVLFIAIVVGVLQASRPGLERAAWELASRWVRKDRVWDIIAWLSFLLGLRLAVSCPLAIGCPDLTFVFSGMFVSVLFLELPLLVFIYPKLLRGKRPAHPENAPVPLKERAQRLLLSCCCRRPAPRKKGTVSSSPDGSLLQLGNGGQRTQKISAAALGDRSPTHGQELPAASVLKFPGSEPLATAAFRLAETLAPSEARGVLLDDPGSMLRRVRNATSCLYYDPPTKLGYEAREQRLLLACKVLRAAAKGQMKKESRPARMAFDELRELCDKELDIARTAIRSRTLSDSYLFTTATMREKTEVIKEAIPSAPQVWLVHWRTLQSLGRLPDMDEKELLVTAPAAYAQFSSKAVLVPVIHRARSEEDADPHRVTCRQLVTFALWYRLRWGKDLEVYYWIDCCCLPEFAHLKQESGADNAQQAASSVGMLNPVARRGLKTLKVWLDAQPPQPIPDITAAEADGVVAVEAAEGERGEGASARPAETAVAIPGGAGPPAAGGAADMLALVEQKEREEENTKDSMPAVTIESADMLLPLIFAAADAVVVCESRDYDESAWVRLHLALAHTFSPSAHHIYLVDRRLIHVPKHIRHPTEPDRPPLMATKNSELPGLSPYAPWQWEELGLPDDEPPALPNSPKFWPPGSALGKSATSGFPGFGATVGSGFSGFGAAMTATGTGFGFHTIAGSTGATFFKDQPGIAEELAGAAMARAELYTLKDPVDWANVHLERPEQVRARIARLTAMCIDFPALFATGGFRRSATKIGETRLRFCRVEPKHAPKRAAATRPDGVPAPPKVRSDGTQKESSSESSGDEALAELELDEDDVLHGRFGKGGEPAFAVRAQNLYHVARSRVAGEGKEAEAAPMLALLEDKRRQVGKNARTTSCWRVGSPVADGAKGPSAAAADMLLRRSADPLSTGNQSPHMASAALKPLSPPKGRRELKLVFHAAFHPDTVAIGSGGVTAEQFRGAVAQQAASSSFASGGMAILSKPLEPRTGVAPDVEIARGVCFSVAVETLDAAWGDGLGIGFTAQDPDQWPSHKLKPRYASSMPSSCLCGYNGRWVVNGHSDFIRKVRGSSHPWTPQTLRRGDVVTAVLAAPPADIFRVLVNGRVVAERSASDLPSPVGGRLWGVVDVDGCCVKLRLGERLPEGVAATTASLSFVTPPEKAEPEPPARR